MIASSCPCRLCEADRQRHPMRTLILYGAAIIALAFASVGLAVGAEAPPASVVKIDGCTGVCVDPSGVILSVKHCGPELQETAQFPGDVGAVRVHRVYVSPETDGPVVFVADQPGDYPASPLGTAPPPVGSRVHSWGYPSNRVGARNLTYAEGVVAAGKKTPPPIGLNPLAPPYRVNVVSGLICDGGWSGGPLFNEAGEVVGLCSAGGPEASLWIGYGDIAIAMAAVPGRRTPAPLKIVDLFTDPSNCLPCRLLETDIETGKFPGYQFNTHLPVADQLAPTLVYLGREQVGYFGAGPLREWLQTCEAESAPAEVPIAQPDRRRPADDIAAVRAQVSQLIEDVRKFQEAGAIGKLRQLDNLKADIAAAKETAEEIRAEFAAVKTDAEGHPWYYGIPAALFGVIKRRYLNRDAVVDV